MLFSVLHHTYTDHNDKCMSELDPLEPPKPSKDMEIIYIPLSSILYQSYSSLFGEHTHELTGKYGSDC